MNSNSFGDANSGYQIGRTDGRVGNHSISLSETSQDPIYPIFTVPYSRNPDFIPPDEESFNVILDKISEPGSRIALLGLGGIGKTQIALEICYRIRGSSPNTGIFWVVATSAARVEESYRDIANFVRIPGRENPEANIFRLVNDWILKRKGKWLLVMDDMNEEIQLHEAPPVAQEDAKSKPSSHLPTSLWSFISENSQGSIIFTTRHQNSVIKRVLASDIFHINPMRESQALALAKLHLPEEKDGEIRALIHLLGGLPLAIIQAVKYINHQSPRLSISIYLFLCRSSESNLRLDTSNHLDHSKHLSTLMQVWIEALRETKPAAIDLLSLISFFGLGGVTSNLLQSHSHEKNPGVEDSSSNLDDRFLESNTRALLSLSLIRICDGKRYILHIAIRNKVRNRLKIQGQDEHWRGVFIRNLSREFPKSDFKSELCQPLFPHLKEAISQRPVIESGSFLEWASLLHRGAEYASKMRNSTDMKQMAMKAVEARYTALGPDHTKTMDSSMLLIQAYSLEGDWKSAEYLCSPLVIRSKHILGEENPRTLNAMNSLALIKWYQGQWQEAEILSREILDFRINMLGKDHADTLTSLSNLALTYWSQGRWKEAEESHFQVMEARKHSLGLEHPDTLTSMNNLASTFWNQGRLKEAEALGSRVLESRIRLFGRDHPDTLISMNTLASVYRDQGRLDAEPISVHDAGTYTSLKGRSHQNTLGSMDNLASEYRNQGRWAEAKALQSQVLRTRKEVLGVNHPDTLRSMSNLATICWHLENFETSEVLQRRVLSILRESLGPEHPEVLAGMRDLALTYQSQGLLNEAKAILLNALKLFQSTLGGEHSDAIRCMGILASIFLAEGRLSDAEDLQARALNLSVRALGKSHSTVLDNMHSLALIYKKQNRWHDAEGAFRSIMTTRQSILGSEHPDFLTSMENLASLLFDLGQWMEAETLQSEVIVSRVNLFGDKHPLTLKASGLLELYSMRRAEDHESSPGGLSDQSDSASIDSKKAAFENSTFHKSDSITGVKLFTSYVLKNIMFRKLCQAAILERNYEQARVRRKLGKLLQRFSSHLSRETRATEHATIVQFIRGASLNIASQILLDLEVASSSTKIQSFQNFQGSIYDARSLQPGQIQHENLKDPLKTSSSLYSASSTPRAITGIPSSILLHSETSTQEKDHKAPPKSEMIAHVGSLQHGERIVPPCDRCRRLHMDCINNTTACIGCTEKHRKCSWLDAKEDEPRASESDEQYYMNLEGSEKREPTLLDGLQRGWDFLFKTNAFEILKSELFDYVYPSFRSILMKWISKKRRHKSFTEKQLRDLEVLVSELQHIPPSDISIILEKTWTMINNIKGKWENFTAETWDWWPLEPYKRPLLNGESRLEWRCCCGKLRWAEVPQEFAKKITSAPKTISQPDVSMSDSFQSLRCIPVVSSSTKSESSHSSIRKTEQTVCTDPSLLQRRPTPQTGSRNNDEHNLHIFLVMIQFSLFGSPYRLAQTSVKSMSDNDFFSWIRTTYNSHRGFLPKWFGVYKYSHCEFFKFQRFLQAVYAPLGAEYPSPEDSSYHFKPRPISPDPPLPPEEFRHWFENASWHATVFQKIKERLYKNTSCFRGFNNDDVVGHLLPKRDTFIEEQDSSREIFWGLYVVETRSIAMLVLYSVFFLIPSLYFFFAWLFSWGHHGDLQNAAIPLSVSIGLLGIFWGCIILNSPSYEVRRKPI